MNKIKHSFLSKKKMFIFFASWWGKFKDENPDLSTPNYHKSHFIILNSFHITDKRYSEGENIKFGKNN